MKRWIKKMLLRYLTPITLKKATKTKQPNGTYITTDGKMQFMLDGIETISLQDAEGVILDIDGHNVYIGSTSQYRLQPIKEKLSEIILVNDKPLLINYKVRLIRRIVQGGN